MANQITAIACLCGLLIPSLVPTSAPAPHVAALDKDLLTPHLGDLESAQKEALERNAPLLIHIILEGEEQNDEYRNGILPHKELIKLSQNCIVVIGNNGEHPQTTFTEKVNGENRKRQACSKYRMFENCAQHREAWSPIYHAYQDDNGELGCPQTVLLTPSGKISWRHNVRNPPSASEVVGAVKEAQKKAGKSLSSEGLRTVKGHHIAAANAGKADNWPTVWNRNQAILELIDVGMWADGARAAQGEALVKMRAQLSSLAEHFVPGEVAEAWRELTLFAQAAKGTPLEREIAQVKKKIERNKDIKEELAAIKTELAAEALEEAAEALLREDEERKAMKLFKKILGKRYAGTETAKRVRHRFPELE